MVIIVQEMFFDCVRILARCNDCATTIARHMPFCMGRNRIAVKRCSGAAPSSGRCPRSMVRKDKEGEHENTPPGNELSALQSFYAEARGLLAAGFWGWLD